jgi:hypothetical protein
MATAATEPVPPVSALPPGAPGRAGRLAAVERRLFAPVDIASLVAFRVCFGAVIVWEVYRYVTRGWVDAYWVAPEFNFSYRGFWWLEPLPAAGMWALFGVLGVLGAGIALGAFYRLCAVAFTVGFTYVFLLEPARYLNHFYLFCLLGGLLAVVPAHRRWSVDAELLGGRRSDTAPTWALWLLRAQVAIVYVYGGLAKLNGDWLRGEPMRAWLAARPDFPLVGRWFGEEWMVYAASYGGLLFDLLIVPAVLWRRTRIAALLAATCFHLMNNELFTIGVFPVLAMAALLLFCEPSWPRDLARRLGPGLRPVAADDAAYRRVSRARARVGVGLLAAFLAVQLLVPLRHHLYEGPSNWSEAGHWFAWHMKLRSKWGDATFVVRDPDAGRTWTVDPVTILAPWQDEKMSIRPELIRQFAVELARRYRDAGHGDVQVFARVHAALNGREPQLLVDPTVDLATQPPRTGPHPWIVPLSSPLGDP